MREILDAKQKKLPPARLVIFKKINEQRKDLEVRYPRIVYNGHVFQFFV